MAKKKLKKLLKKALPLAALAAGATMLGRRRQNNEFLKTEGGNLSILPQAKRMMNVADMLTSRFLFVLDIQVIARFCTDRCCPAKG